MSICLFRPGQCFALGDVVRSQTVKLRLVQFLFSRLRFAVCAPFIERDQRFAFGAFCFQRSQQIAVISFFCHVPLLRRFAVVIGFVRGQAERSNQRVAPAVCNGGAHGLRIHFQKRDLDRRPLEIGARDVD